MERRTIDFTQGNILKKLTLFAIPIVLAELLQNLYNTADALVVGNFVGAKALAAVSVCTAISQMVVGFFNGMSIGASVVVSRYFGAGEEDLVRLDALLRWDAIRKEGVKSFPEGLGWRREWRDRVLVEVFPVDIVALVEGRKAERKETIVPCENIFSMPV